MTVLGGLWPDCFLLSSSASHNTVRICFTCPKPIPAQINLSVRPCPRWTRDRQPDKTVSDCFPIVHLDVSMFFSVDNREKSRLSLVMWSCPQITVFVLITGVCTRISRCVLCPWTTIWSEQPRVVVFSADSNVRQAVQNNVVSATQFHQSSRPWQWT